MAGHASPSRKMATPARTTRISAPDATVAPEKIRSPRRTTGRDQTPGACGAADSSTVVLTALRGQGSGGRAADGLDGRLDLGADGVRERGGAGVVGSLLLAVGGGDVLQVRLHEVGLLGVVVLGAGHRVGDEHDRVRAGLRRRALEVVREDVLARVLALLGGVEDLRGGLRVGLDELAADADLDLAEVAGLALVGVADRA